MQKYQQVWKKGKVEIGNHDLYINLFKLRCIMYRFLFNNANFNRRTWNFM